MSTITIFIVYHKEIFLKQCLQSIQKDRIMLSFSFDNQMKMVQTKYSVLAAQHVEIRYTSHTGMAGSGLS